MGNKTPKGFTRATSKRRGDATFPLPLKKPPHPPQPQHPSRGVWRLLRLLWVFPKGQRFQASSKLSDIVRRTDTRTRVEWCAERRNGAITAAPKLLRPPAQMCR